MKVTQSNNQSPLNSRPKWLQTSAINLIDCRPPRSPDGGLVEQPVERERGGAEEAVGEEAVEGQDLHLHVLVTVDRRRYRPREPLRGEEDKQGTVQLWLLDKY